MSLIANISELKKGKWYHSPNLWAPDRPHAVEMNKENSEFIQKQIEKKILFTTAEEATTQAISILNFIGGVFEMPVATFDQRSCRSADYNNLDLFGDVA